MALNVDYTSTLLRSLRDPAALSSNIAVVQGLYSALAAGSFESIAEFMTEDVTFDLHDSTGILSGRWSGRDAVIAAIRVNFAKVDQQKPELKGMVADASTVAVLFSESGVVAATGQPYQGHGIQWFTIDGGKVRRLEEILALAL